MYQRKNNKEKKKGKQSFPKGTVITDSFLFNVKKVECTESRLADRLRIQAEVLSWADLSFADIRSKLYIQSIAPGEKNHLDHSPKALGLR